MNVETTVMLGLFFLLVGVVIVIWKMGNKEGKLDLIHKDETKLSEENNIQPNMENIKEALAKKPRSKRPSRKKPQQEDKCELVDTVVAEKPVRKAAKK